MLFIFKSDLIENAKADSPDFLITTNSNFDNGTKYWTSTSTDRYNQSDNSLELDFPFASKDAEDGLVSYWRFEGNADDETPRGNDGVITSATYNSSGAYGTGAYDFDATDDTIVVSNDASLDIVQGNYSISFWTAPHTTTDDIALYHERWYVYYLTSGYIRFVYNSDAGGGNIKSNIQMVPYYWYQVTLVCNGGTSAYIYVNGTVDAGGLGNYDCTRDNAPTVDFVVSLTSSGADAVIDELRLYNRSITAREVKELYNMGYRYSTPDIIQNDTYSTITVEDDKYGSVDYQPQIFTNSRGDLAAIYSIQDVPDVERGIMKYSTDNGLSWSDRVVLFSNATQGDGIIDNDYGVGEEIHGYVLNDTLYIAIHLNNAYNQGSGYTQAVFTKIDIKNITNIKYYQYWKSASGVSAPSQGNAVDGQGYDMLTELSSDLIYPIIAVKSDNDIMVTLSILNETVYATRWNGTSWSSITPIKTFPYDTTYGSIRLMADGSWVMANAIVAPDSNHFDVVTHCNATDDPLVASNWNDMTGTHSFDYVLDTGASGAMTISDIRVDAHGYVHIVGITTYTISAAYRLFHNYWDGTQWVNGEAENNAGSIVSFTKDGVLEPELMGFSYRYLDANVDGNGNLFVLFAHGGTQGMWSLKWNETTGWNPLTYRKETANSQTSIVVGGSTGGSDTIMPFLIWGCNIMCYVGVWGGESGVPFWDSGADYTEVSWGYWESDTITMPNNYYLLNLTITYDNVTTGESYIGRIYFKENGNVTAEYTMDISTGTSATITTATWGSLSDIDSDFTIRIYPMSNGTTTPTIESLYGYYELGNTAPTITNCPTDTLLYREGENVQLEFTASESVTWSISGDPLWLEIGSSTGITNGNTYVVDNDKTFTFTVTATDSGSLTDTCTFSITVLNEEEIKYGNLTYEWNCRQVSWNALECWVNEWGSIDLSKLNFSWVIDGKSYNGRDVTHIFPKGFRVNSFAMVDLSVSFKNSSFSKNETKTFWGNYIPWEWFLLLILVIILIYSDYKVAKSIRRKRRYYA